MSKNLSKQHDKTAFRIAQILIKLNNGETLNLLELAQEFNVSTRTISRDLQRLDFLPIIKEGRAFKLEAYALGRLNFNNLRYFLKICDLNDLFPSKSDGSLTDLLNEKLNAALLINATGHQKLDNKSKDFDDLNVAILETRWIKFFYKQKERIVEPYKLINNSGIWYLIAKEEGKHKTFTFSKISTLSILDKKFIPDSETLALIEANETSFIADTYTKVLVKIDAFASEYFLKRKILKNQKLLAKETDGIILETKISYEDEFLMLVQHWIPHIQILEPTYLHKKLIQRLQNYLQVSQNQ